MPAHTQYRAIFRFSLDGDDNSAIRNGVIKRLEDIGFRNTATGIWETPSSSIRDIQKLLSHVMDELAGFSMDAESSPVLDHMWFYIDRAECA
jgi:hypothetical protein